MENEKIYIQNNEDMENVLRFIGIDDLKMAENICGRNIYALETDCYDGEYGEVIALFSYSNNPGYKILTDKNGILLPKVTEDVKFFRDCYEEDRKIFSNEIQEV